MGKYLCALMLLAGLMPVTVSHAGAQTYAWLKEPPARTLIETFAPPSGYGRVAASAGSFAHWLRHLPLKPENAPVLLFNGSPRADQSGAAAVIDIDVGQRDLQQCADAVIRLRAEYLYAGNRQQPLAFTFTSGDRYGFQDWRQGRTPKVSGNRVAWVSGAPKPQDHASLRQWLDVVFTYAGSLSLQRELKPVANIGAVEPGDVLIQGGSPGHAVIVLDVARDGGNRPAVLLAQSYMPAQSVHVLRNPAGGVWYRLEENAAIVTPDWRFSPKDLRRFD